MSEFTLLYILRSAPENNKKRKGNWKKINKKHNKTKSNQKKRENPQTITCYMHASSYIDFYAECNASDIVVTLHPSL